VIEALPVGVGKARPRREKGLSVVVFGFPITKEYPSKRKKSN